MEISDTRKLLFAVVDQAQGAREVWSKSEVEHFTEAMLQAFDELVDTFADTDLPADCRNLATAVGQFAHEWSKWRDVAEHSGDERLLPDPAVWRTLDVVEQMRRAAVPRKAVKLETIAELTEQKVGERQIALIYGFLTPDGAPDMAMVREERSSPGKHTGEGTGWLPPFERQQREEAHRQAERAKRIQARQQAKMQRLEHSAPESLRELVEDDVALPQIAKILNMSEADVLLQCEAEGLPAPPASYPSGNAMRGVHDKEPTEAQQRTYDAMAANPVQGGEIPEYKEIGELPPTEAERLLASQLEDGASGPMTLEREIVHYRNTTDMTNAQIAEAVTSESAPVSRQKVTGVLERYKSQPEAFEPVGTG